MVLGLGKRIKSAREALDKTQAVVADEIGFSKPTISAWESDKTEPKPSQLIALAKVLKVTIYDLLEGKPAEKKRQNDDYPEIKFHESPQGLKWIVDPGAYPSESNVWVNRMRRSAQLFSDILHSKPINFDSKDDIRLRAALEARFIRFTHVPRNREMEAKLVREYGLKSERVVVVNIDMHADSSIKGLIGAEIVAFAAACTEHDVFIHKTTESTMIGICHGLTMQRFVSNIRPSGYAYEGKKFLALTASKDPNLAYPDREANAVVSALGSKFPGGQTVHMPYLDLEQQRAVFDPESVFLDFPKGTLENTVLDILDSLRAQKAVSVYLSCIIDSGDMPLPGWGKKITEAFYKDLQDKGLLDQLGGEICGIALDKMGGVLNRHHYCSVPPHFFQALVKQDKLVWLIGAGCQREISFRTCLNAKIVNGIVVTRDLAEALLKETGV